MQRRSSDFVWDTLSAGDVLEIVKLAPNGRDVAQYAGEVIRFSDEWLEVTATWTYRHVESHGLEFDPGDRLIEYFSPRSYFNVFLVMSPANEIRGWYGNVTSPAWIEEVGSSKRLFWHDLYLDVIALPDGSVVVADQDEFEESGLKASDPELAKKVRAACEEMVTLAGREQYPFHVPEERRIATRG